MTNFDRLPHHKQMAVIYEITGVGRQKIAMDLGVLPETITSWRKDPVYQAAKQEKAVELQGSILDRYTKHRSVTLDSAWNELVKRLNDPSEIEGVSTMQLVKIISSFMKDFTKEGSDSPDPSSPSSGTVSESEDDFTKRLRERYKTSSTGRQAQKNEKKKS
jgi:hypothetical protein